LENIFPFLGDILDWDSTTIFSAKGHDPWRRTGNISTRPKEH